MIDAGGELTPNGRSELARSTADAAARDESQDYLWTLNFGPQHPATHTTLRLVLTLDGETVVKAVPDIGYLHCGFEKLGEDLDYNQYVTIVDRMNYISPMANEIAWHHAVEKLLGIELTPRCKYIRVILAELIADQRPSALRRRGGARPRRLHRLPVRLLPARDDLRHLRDALRASGSTNSYTRVGGLMCDVTTLVVEKIRDFVKDFPEDARRHGAAAQPQSHLHRPHQGHRRARRRKRRSTAACTGPIARASGVVRDLRKDEPYLAYGTSISRSCCATAGDCYRPLPRPHGRDAARACKIVAPGDREPAVRAGQRAIGEQDGAARTSGWSTRRIEGTDPALRAGDDATAALEVAGRRGAMRRSRRPTANWGSTSSATAPDVAYRARCRPPSFIHFALFPYLIGGHTLSDVVAVLGSLNIIAAELDR